jgi:hypothetical protein
MSSTSLLPIEDLKPWVPPHYSSLGPARVETGAEREEYPSERLKFSIPVWIIRGEGLRIRAVKPILIRVKSEGSHYFAENDTLELYGAGSSANDAILDLCVHIAHFYRYYKDLAHSQIVGEAIRLKALFSELFVEE